MRDGVLKNFINFYLRSNGRFEIIIICGINCDMWYYKHFLDYEQVCEFANRWNLTREDFFPVKAAAGVGIMYYSNNGELY